MADDIDPMMQQEMVVEPREPFWSIEPSRRTSFAFWFWVIFCVFILGLCYFNWHRLDPSGTDIQRENWTVYIYFLGIVYLVAGNFVEIGMASFIMTFVIFEGQIAMTYAEKMLQDSKNRFVEITQRRKNLENQLEELKKENEELRDQLKNPPE